LEALSDGASAIAAVTGFDATGFPCTVAAAMPRAVADEDRRLAFASRAADEAWRAAEITGGTIGVFIGAESGRGRFETVLGLARAAGGGTAFDHDRFGRDARDMHDGFGIVAVHVEDRRLHHQRNIGRVGRGT